MLCPRDLFRGASLEGEHLGTGKIGGSERRRTNPWFLVQPACVGRRRTCFGPGVTLEKLVIMDTFCLSGAVPPGYSAIREPSEAEKGLWPVIVFPSLVSMVVSSFACFRSLPTAPQVLVL